MCTKRRCRGLTLIEMVVFVVVLGIGFSALIVLYNQATQSSVDPVVRKQVLALASSMLEEVQLRGFTHCDPNDANVYTASTTSVGPTGCAAASTQENMGPETISPGIFETRLGTTDQFDNVNDYHGFTMSGSSPSSPTRIRDMAGNDVTGLDGYSVSVSVEERGGDFTLTGNVLADPEALRITVTAVGPGNVSVSLQGYRVRYAPNSP